jgi:hypothetical protein
MSANIMKMQEKYGSHLFNIIPETYLMPDDFHQFYQRFHQLQKEENDALWIIKPNDMSRGRGIYIVSILTSRLTFESLVAKRTASSLGTFPILSSSTAISLIFVSMCA